MPGRATGPRRHTTGAWMTQLEALRLECDRRSAGAQRLQMMMKTFVSLSLTERTALLETLLSLTCSLLEVRHGAVLLEQEEAGPLQVQSAYDLEAPQALLGPGAVALWREVLAGRVAATFSGAALGADWPGAPPALLDQLAAVTIDLDDRAVGLLVVAGKASGQPFDPPDLDFLAAAGGVAALVLANAEFHQAQQALLRRVEQEAATARDQARLKQRALEDLDRQLQVVARQQRAIKELSTPILRIWDDVLTLPVIGVIDQDRSAAIMQRLLDAVAHEPCRHVIVDLTGVEVIDTQAANHLIKIKCAVELLGARCLLTGIRPAVAQAITELGLDLSTVVTRADLKGGLQHCLRAMAGAPRAPAAPPAPAPQGRPSRCPPR